MISPDKMPPLPQDWVKSVKSPSAEAPTLKKTVPEKDIHGPLEGSETLMKTVRPEEVGMEEYTEPDKAETLKTDATIEHEKAIIASKYPTVKTAGTGELEAERAQTFKTGATIEREEEEAEKEAEYKRYESLNTVRELNKGWMEYDAIHDRITDRLKMVDALLASPNTMAELKDLKEKIEVAKAAVEGQLDLEQYGIAKQEAGAAPFKVAIPEDWFQLEGRIDEIMDTMKAGKTVREPKDMEAPTVRMDEAA